MNKVGVDAAELSAHDVLYEYKDNFMLTVHVTDMFLHVVSHGATRYVCRAVTCCS